jgi:hypothetical protein
VGHGRASDGEKPSTSGEEAETEHRRTFSHAAEKSSKHGIHQITAIDIETNNYFRETYSHYSAQLVAMTT